MEHLPIVVPSSLTIIVSCPASLTGHKKAVLHVRPVALLIRPGQKHTPRVPLLAPLSAMAVYFLQRFELAALMLNVDHMMAVALALFTRAHHCTALTTRFLPPLTRLLDS
jgi:hypothetical protein